MENIFIQLAVILGLSSSLGFLVYRFKLPLLIAYMLAGLFLSAFLSFDITNSLILSFLPNIGIAFVLFLVGMELDLREIRSFGKQILIAGILQIIITSVFGTFIAQTFGLGLTESIYLGIGLSFSSTIVVVKLLSDRKDLTSLHGKLSLGILLLEDLLAVLILLAMTSSTTSISLAMFVIKVFGLFSLALLLSHFVLPVIFRAVSDSGELLFLTALAWCFVFITLAQGLGFSILIGAFLAGVALASSPYHFQIQGKVKPLRDFFITLFFVYLGTRVNFGDIFTNYQLILLFAAYAMFIKPVIFLLILGIFGFRRHTMFNTAINLSQISEFSLIILLVGLQLGIVSDSVLTVIALSTIISIVGSSMMIFNSKNIYRVISSAITFFERKRHLPAEEGAKNDLTDHVVLLGAHQVGERIIVFLKQEKIPFLVLDFNPHQVENLSKLGVPVIFGDMSDPEVLDILNLSKARLIVSTVPDMNDNKLLIEDLNNLNVDAPVIVRAENIREAKILYKFGADFVYIPDVVSGEYLVEIFKGHLNERDYFKQRPKIELEKLTRKTLAWE